MMRDRDLEHVRFATSSFGPPPLTGVRYQPSPDEVPDCCLNSLPSTDLSVVLTVIRALIQVAEHPRSIQAFGSIAEFEIHLKHMSTDYLFGMLRCRGINRVCFLIVQMAHQIETKWDVPEVHDARKNAHDFDV